MRVSPNRHVTTERERPVLTIADYQNVLRILTRVQLNGLEEAKAVVILESHVKQAIELLMQPAEATKEATCA